MWLFIYTEYHTFTEYAECPDQWNDLCLVLFWLWDFGYFLKLHNSPWVKDKNVIISNSDSVLMDLPEIMTLNFLIIP